MLTSAEFVWLLAAVAKGDQPAFERLYAATRAKLYGVVLRIVRRLDLADEIMQETYLAVWTRAGQFDPRRSDPVGWMVAIARKHALDRVRRAADLALDEEPEAPEGAAAPVQKIRPELSENLRRLLACMGRLEEERRRLVLLAYYDGWSRDQLAAKFGQPVETITTWLHEAMAGIRECLGS